MSPLQIEILLWYHARGEDYRQGDFSAPAVREAIDSFRDVEKLIEPIGSAKHVGDFRTYRLTDRGQAYVDALLAVPLPLCRWEIPDHRKGADNHE